MYDQSIVEVGIFFVKQQCDVSVIFLVAYVRKSEIPDFSSKYLVRFSAYAKGILMVEGCQ